MSTRERLITLFQDNSGDLISGEELSTNLGVSRTSVWKHISQLRKLGYLIEAILERVGMHGYIIDRFYQCRQVFSMVALVAASPGSKII